MPLRFTSKQLDFTGQAYFFLTLLGIALLYYQKGGVDFRTYYSAALLVTQGGNPYEYAQLAPVLLEVTGYAGNFPYFYPPYFLLPFFPFLLLPFDLARLAWLLLSAGLFYASLELLRAALGWQVRGWRRWSAYLLALLLLGLMCLRSEQATVLVLFGLALLLRALRRSNPIQAGFGAVLVTVKPQVTLLLCLFLVVWLFRHNRRAFWASAGWLAGLLGLSTLIMPSWWQFDRTNFGSGLFYYWEGTQAITALRVNATLYDFLQHALQLSPPFQALTGLVIFLLGGALALTTLGQNGSQPPYLAASGLVILNLLITPYALQYDYILLTAPLLWMLARLPGLPPAGRWITGLLIAASFATLLLQTWSYQGYWQLLFLSAAFALVLFFTTISFRPQTALKPAA